MGNFFTLHFWFNMNSSSLVSWASKGLIVFLIVLLGLYFFANLKKEKGVFELPGFFWKKIKNYALANFLIGLFLFFFTYEEISFFSARFWFLIWLTILIVWPVKLYEKVKKRKEVKELHKQKEEYQKYIP